MRTTIAVSNQKGGVAKTTTCVSLGAALAELGHSVLLVDLDPQANLTLSLGLKPEELRRSIIDTLMGNDPLVGVSRETEVLALDIVPASYDLALMNKLLYRQKGYQYRLKQVLRQVPPGLYDYILLDCPPSLAPLTLNALTTADLLIIPTQCEYYSARSLSQTIRLALQIRKQSNPRIIYRVLITMYDQRNKINRLVLEQMRTGLTNVLFRTIIQIDTKLKESPAYGKPITTYAPKSRGTRQYQALARELASPGFSRLLKPKSRAHAARQGRGMQSKPEGDRPTGPESSEASRQLKATQTQKTERNHG